MSSPEPNEQDRWLNQPQPDRGLSPERQMRQPLGFRSKRQYREESIYGYQDLAFREIREEQQWEDLYELFETDEEERNFILSDSPAKIEERFKNIARLDKMLEKDKNFEQEDIFFPKINVTGYEEEDVRWHWERRGMPSGKTIGVKVYDY